MAPASYKLIEFTKESRNKNRCVDFVPRDWIKFDPEIGELVTKFMPPPYDEENLALLHSLVECRAPAPKNWPVFPVVIRGEASTYGDAAKKLKVLNRKEYAFSSDTDETSRQKALAAGNEYYGQGLEEDDGDSWDVPELVQSDCQSHDQTSPGPRGRKKSESQVNSAVKKMASKKDKAEKDSTLSVKTKGRKKAAPQKSTRTASIISNSQEKLNSKSSPSRDEIGDGCGGTSLECSEIIELDENENLSLQKKNDDKGSDKGTDDDNFDANLLFSDMLTVMTPDALTEEIKLLIVKGFSSQTIQMTRLSTQIEELKILVKGLNSGVHANVSVVDFAAKWDLKLPIQTLEDFQIFDGKLTVDREFQRDAVSSMSGSADATVLLSNSIRNILKKFMSRDLTLQFTTVKDIGKQILCKTKFYSCVQAVVCAIYKENTSVSPISDKDFEHAVGKVMNNAKDWEGHRATRSKKK